MTRRYAVPATGLTRESLPEKPYLWRGERGLAEVNARLMDERPEAIRHAPQLAFFAWPQPLPGPPHQRGGGKPEEVPGERTQVA